MRAVLASVFGDVAFMGFQHGLVGVQEVIQAEDFQRNKGGEMKVPHGVQNGVQRSGRHVVQGFVVPFSSPCRWHMRMSGSQSGRSFSGRRPSFQTWPMSKQREWGVASTSLSR